MGPGPPLPNPHRLLLDGQSPGGTSQYFARARVGALASYLRHEAVIELTQGAAAVGVSTGWCTRIQLEGQLQRGRQHAYPFCDPLWAW